MYKSQMKPPRPEKVPANLEKAGQAATLTQSWWVKDTPFHPSEAHYKLLINGEAAFGELEKDIRRATHSIDLVCWGFQPSMYFVRKGQDKKMIGQLLEEKARANVKVRILAWFNTTHTGQFMEPTLPGYTSARMIKPKNPKILIPGGPNAKFDIGLIPYATPKQKDFDLEWMSRVNNNKIPNLQLKVRAFSIKEHHAIASGLKQSIDQGPLSLLHKILLTNFPSHHQKAALIDYEIPNRACGYVMGHNSTSQYWDTNAHSAKRATCDTGRDGPSPFQDNSARVTGAILFGLNQNFCEAWDKVSNEGLMKKRLARIPSYKSLPAIAFPGSHHITAQLMRTQPQHKDYGIEQMYMEFCKNARHYIYFENQYFRLPPLIESIKTVVKARKTYTDKNPLHLFVITNSTQDSSVHAGSYNTWRMLKALGREDRVPGYKAIADRDKLKQERIPLRLITNSRNSSPQARSKAIERLRQIDKEEEELLTKEVKPRDIAGIKSHICTLIAPDDQAVLGPSNHWPPKKDDKEKFSTKRWMNAVYIHSKLTLIDDTYMTHGSANLNLRSMEVDSELNIGFPDINYKVIRPYRKTIWNIHTGGKGYHMVAAEAFEAWGRILANNKKLEETGGRPIASIIPFFDNQLDWQKRD